MKSTIAFLSICALLMTVLAIGLISGCTDANVSKLTAYGTEFKVTLYSGGEPVRSWTSTGRVQTESQTDGWYFRDKETNKLIRLSGNVVIEEQ